MQLRIYSRDVLTSITRKRLPLGDSEDCVKKEPLPRNADGSVDEDAVCEFIYE